MAGLQVVCAQLIDTVRAFGGQRWRPERKGLRQPVLAAVDERQQFVAVFAQKLEVSTKKITYRLGSDLALELVVASVALKLPKVVWVSAKHEQK